MRRVGRPPKRKQAGSAAAVADAGAATGTATATKSGPPAKKAKPTPAADAPEFTPEEITAMMEILEPKAIFTLLHRAAVTHDDVAQTIKTRYDGFQKTLEKRKAKEKQKVLNFDHYYNRAEKKMWPANSNKSYGYTAVLDMGFQIDKMFDVMAEKARDEDASFGTKFNALNTTLDILANEGLGGDEIGRYLRQHAQQEHWGRRILDLLDAFEEYELEHLVFEVKINQGTWTDRLKEVADLQSGYCLSEELYEAVALLEGVKSKGKTQVH